MIYLTEATPKTIRDALKEYPNNECRCPVEFNDGILHRAEFKLIYRGNLIEIELNIEEDYSGYIFNFKDINILKKELDKLLKKCDLTVTKRLIRIGANNNKKTLDQDMFNTIKYLLNLIKKEGFVLLDQNKPKMIK